MAATPDVRVSANQQDLFQAAANLFQEIVRGAVSTRGRCTIALSGGSTPRGLFTLLAQEPYRSAIPWSQCEFFWGDERCVPPDDPESNYRMARETLLDRVPVPVAHIHRMHGEDPPAQAAEDYERELRRIFASDGDWPRFDLILLGMGDDGHTASLFPGSAALAETQHWVVAHYVEQVHMNRLTLTLPVLNHARHIVFLVSGASKAPALRTVLASSGGADSLPSARVRPIDGQLIWLVDAAAMANERAK